MELKEARRVAEIVATAEGGCGGCIDQATIELNKHFTDFIWTRVKVPGFMDSIDVKRTKRKTVPVVAVSSLC